MHTSAFFYVKPSYYQATLQKIPKYASQVQQRPRTVPSWRNRYPILEVLNIVYMHAVPSMGMVMIPV